MLLGLLVVCVVLFVVLPMIGAAVSIVSSLLVALALGIAARLIAPGGARVGLVLTTLAGLAGSMLGATLAQIAKTGQFGRLLLQLFVAVIVVMALRPAHRRSGRPRKKATR